MWFMAADGLELRYSMGLLNWIARDACIDDLGNQPRLEKDTATDLAFCECQRDRHGLLSSRNSHAHPVRRGVHDFSQVLEGQQGTIVR